MHDLILCCTPILHQLSDCSNVCLVEQIRSENKKNLQHVNVIVTYLKECVKSCVVISIKLKGTCSGNVAKNRIMFKFFYIS